VSDRIKDPGAPRMLSVTITGPEGMLEAMANLLRGEGYIATRSVAEAFDVVLEAYISDRPERVDPREITALEIVEWCGEPVDGVEERDGVRMEYWGAATRQPDGTYHGIANVDGALCKVACRIVERGG
jgi:hypothetical protein